MSNGWYWVCDITRHSHSNLWNIWRKEGVASIGWPIEVKDQRNKRLETTIRSMNKGDRIVAYLKNKRIGGIGNFAGDLRLEDCQFNPLIQDKNEPHGRQVGMNWNSLPDEGYYVAIPENVKTPGPRTFQRIPGKELELLEEAVSNREMWDHLADSKELVGKGEETARLHPIVSNNLTRLEPGLKVYDQQHKTEYPARPIGLIDILAKDAEGTPVIIEMKTHSVKDDVVGQTLRYMSWIREHFAQSKVRGIIVAGEFTPFTRYAALDIPNLMLVRYSIKNDMIEFNEVKKKPYHVNKEQWV